MKEEPAYYAIIPAPVRYSDKITGNEKLLYGEITCLSSKKGYCYASNNYFADLYKVTPRTIKYWIANLVDQGFIKKDLEIDGANTSRKLYIIGHQIYQLGVKISSQPLVKKTSP